MRVGPSIELQGPSSCAKRSHHSSNRVTSPLREVQIKQSTYVLTLASDSFTHHLLLKWHHYLSLISPLERACGWAGLPLPRLGVLRWSPDSPA